MPAVELQSQATLVSAGGQVSGDASESCLVLTLADERDLSTFGILLRGAREDRRMTLQAVAEALTATGVSVTYQAVGAWERGENEPARDKVFALEKLLERPGVFSAALGYNPVAAEDDGMDFNSRIAHISEGARRAIEAIIDAEERRASS